MHYRYVLLASLVAACATDAPVEEVEEDPEPLLRIGGSNCAGVAPVMYADDGVARPPQSVLAHYYALLKLHRKKVGDRPSLQTEVPRHLRGDVAYRTWQAKTVEILGDLGDVGFADRWYEGGFGQLETAEAAAPTCTPVDPELYRRAGLLAHTGLLQAGKCGVNSNGDPKFYEVRAIQLLWLGRMYDVEALVDARLAGPPGPGAAGQCLQWGDDGCAVAYRTDAVTEAVVLDLESYEVVANVPIMRRAFSARGVEEMPNDLDEARAVLRSDELAAATAIGQPQFSYAGLRFDEIEEEWKHVVWLAGHAGGPLEIDNPLLRDEERDQIESTVGRWEERCCTTTCVPTMLDAGVIAPALVGPGCEEKTECIPEGECETGWWSDGLAVVVTSDTFAECAGDCPHPATNPPPEPPGCVL